MTLDIEYLNDYERENLPENMKRRLIASRKKKEAKRKQEEEEQRRIADQVKQIQAMASMHESMIGDIGAFMEEELESTIGAQKPLSSADTAYPEDDNNKSLDLTDLLNDSMLEVEAAPVEEKKKKKKKKEKEIPVEVDNTQYTEEEMTYLSQNERMTLAKGKRKILVNRRKIQEAKKKREEEEKKKMEDEIKRIQEMADLQLSLVGEMAFGMEEDEEEQKADDQSKPEPADRRRVMRGMEKKSPESKQDKYLSRSGRRFDWNSFAGDEEPNDSSEKSLTLEKEPVAPIEVENKVFDWSTYMDEVKKISDDISKEKMKKFDHKLRKQKEKEEKAKQKEKEKAAKAAAKQQRRRQSIAVTPSAKSKKAGNKKQNLAQSLSFLQGSADNIILPDDVETVAELSVATFKPIVEEDTKVDVVDITKSTPSEKKESSTASKKSSKRRKSAAAAGPGLLAQKLQMFQKELPTAMSDDAKTIAELSVDSFKPVDDSVSIKLDRPAPPKSKKKKKGKLQPLTIQEEDDEDNGDVDSDDVAGPTTFKSFDINHSSFNQLGLKKKGPKKNKRRQSTSSLGGGGLARRLQMIQKDIGPGPTPDDVQSVAELSIDTFKPIDEASTSQKISLVNMDKKVDYSDDESDEEIDIKKIEKLKKKKKKQLSSKLKVKKVEEVTFKSDDDMDFQVVDDKPAHSRSLVDLNKLSNQAKMTAEEALEELRASEAEQAQLALKRKAAADRARKAFLKLKVKEVEEVEFGPAEEEHFKTVRPDAGGSSGVDLTRLQTANYEDEDSDHPPDIAAMRERAEKRAREQLGKLKVDKVDDVHFEDKDESTFKTVKTDAATGKIYLDRQSQSEEGALEPENEEEIKILRAKRKAANARAKKSLAQMKANDVNEVEFDSDTDFEEYEGHEGSQTGVVNLNRRGPIVEEETEEELPSVAAIHKAAAARIRKKTKKPKVAEVEEVEFDDEEDNFDPATVRDVGYGSIDTSRRRSSESDEEDVDDDDVTEVVRAKKTKKPVKAKARKKTGKHKGKDEEEVEFYDEEDNFDPATAKDVGYGGIDTNRRRSSESDEEDDDDVTEVVRAKKTKKPVKAKARKKTGKHEGKDEEEVEFDDEDDDFDPATAKDVGYGGIDTNRGQSREIDEDDNDDVAEVLRSPKAKKASNDKARKKAGKSKGHDVEEVEFDNDDDNETDPAITRDVGVNVVDTSRGRSSDSDDDDDDDDDEAAVLRAKKEKKALKAKARKKIGKLKDNEVEEVDFDEEDGNFDPATAKDVGYGGIDTNRRRASESDGDEDDDDVAQVVRSKKAKKPVKAKAQKKTRKPKGDEEEEVEFDDEDDNFDAATTRDVGVGGIDMNRNRESDSDDDDDDDEAAVLRSKKEKKVLKAKARKKIGKPKGDDVEEVEFEDDNDFDQDSTQVIDAGGIDINRNRASDSDDDDDDEAAVLRSKKEKKALKAKARKKIGKDHATDAEEVEFEDSDGEGFDSQDVGVGSIDTNRRSQNDEDEEVNMPPKSQKAKKAGESKARKKTGKKTADADEAEFENSEDDFDPDNTEDVAVGGIDTNRGRQDDENHSKPKKAEKSKKGQKTKKSKKQVTDDDDVEEEDFDGSGDDDYDEHAEAAPSIDLERGHHSTKEESKDKRSRKAKAKKVGKTSKEEANFSDEEYDNEDEAESTGEGLSIDTERGNKAGDDGVSSSERSPKTKKATRKSSRDDGDDEEEWESDDSDYNEKTTFVEEGGSIDLDGKKSKARKPGKKRSSIQKKTNDVNTVEENREEVLFSDEEVDDAGDDRDGPHIDLDRKKKKTSKTKKTGKGLEDDDVDDDEDNDDDVKESRQKRGKGVTDKSSSKSGTKKSKKKVRSKESTGVDGNVDEEEQSEGEDSYDEDPSLEGNNSSSRVKNKKLKKSRSLRSKDIFADDEDEDEMEQSDDEGESDQDEDEVGSSVMKEGKGKKAKSSTKSRRSKAEKKRRTSKKQSNAAENDIDEMEDSQSEDDYSDSDHSGDDSDPSKVKRRISKRQSLRSKDIFADDGDVDEMEHSDDEGESDQGEDEVDPSVTKEGKGKKAKSSSKSRLSKAEKKRHTSKKQSNAAENVDEMEDSQSEDDYSDRDHSGDDSDEGNKPPTKIKRRISKRQSLRSKDIFAEDDMEQSDEEDDDEVESDYSEDEIDPSVAKERKGKKAKSKSGRPKSGKGRRASKKQNDVAEIDGDGEDEYNEAESDHSEDEVDPSKQKRDGDGDGDGGRRKSASKGQLKKTKNKNLSSKSGGVEVDGMENAGSDDGVRATVEGDEPSVEDHSNRNATTKKKSVMNTVSAGAALEDERAFEDGEGMKRTDPVRKTNSSQPPPGSEIPLQSIRHGDHTHADTFPQKPSRRSSSQGDRRALQQKRPLEHEDSHEINLRGTHASGSSRRSDDVFLRDGETPKERGRGDLAEVEGNREYRPHDGRGNNSGSILSLGFDESSDEEDNLFMDGSDTGRYQGRDSRRRDWDRYTTDDSGDYEGSDEENVSSLLDIESRRSDPNSYSLQATTATNGEEQVLNPASNNNVNATAIEAEQQLYVNENVALEATNGVSETVVSHDGMQTDVPLEDIQGIPSTGAMSSQQRSNTQSAREADKIESAPESRTHQDEYDDDDEDFDEDDDEDFDEDDDEDDDEDYDEDHVWDSDDDDSVSDLIKNRRDDWANFDEENSEEEEGEKEFLYPEEEEDVSVSEGKQKKRRGKALWKKVKNIRKAVKKGRKTGGKFSKFDDGDSEEEEIVEQTKMKMRKSLIPKRRKAAKKSEVDVVKSAEQGDSPKSSGAKENNDGRKGKRLWGKVKNIRKSIATKGGKNSGGKHSDETPKSSIASPDSMDSVERSSDKGALDSHDKHTNEGNKKWSVKGLLKRGRIRRKQKKKLSVGDGESDYESEDDQSVISHMSEVDEEEAGHTDHLEQDRSNKKMSGISKGNPSTSSQKVSNDTFNQRNVVIAEPGRSATAPTVERSDGSHPRKSEGHTRNPEPGRSATAPTVERSDGSHPRKSAGHTRNPGSKPNDRQFQVGVADSSLNQIEGAVMSDKASVRQLPNERHFQVGVADSSQNQFEGAVMSDKASVRKLVEPGEETRESEEGSKNQHGKEIPAPVAKKLSATGKTPPVRKKGIAAKKESSKGSGSIGKGRTNGKRSEEAAIATTHVGGNREDQSNNKSSEEAEVAFAKERNSENEARSQAAKTRQTTVSKGRKGEPHTRQNVKPSYRDEDARDHQSEDHIDDRSEEGSDEDWEDMSSDDEEEENESQATSEEDEVEEDEEHPIDDKEGEEDEILEVEEHPIDDKEGEEEEDQNPEVEEYPIDDKEEEEEEDQNPEDEEHLIDDKDGEEEEDQNPEVEEHPIDDREEEEEELNESPHSSRSPVESQQAEQNENSNVEESIVGEHGVGEDQSKKSEQNGDAVVNEDDEAVNAGQSDNSGSNVHHKKREKAKQSLHTEENELEEQSTDSNTGERVDLHHSEGDYDDPVDTPGPMETGHRTLAPRGAKEGPGVESMATTTEVEAEHQDDDDDDDDAPNEEETKYESSDYDDSTNEDEDDADSAEDTEGEVEEETLEDETKPREEEIDEDAQEEKLDSKSSEVRKPANEKPISHDESSQGHKDEAQPCDDEIDADALKETNNSKSSQGMVKEPAPEKPIPDDESSESDGDSDVSCDDALPTLTDAGKRRYSVLQTPNVEKWDTIGDWNYEPREAELNAFMFENSKEDAEAALKLEHQEEIKRLTNEKVELDEDLKEVEKRETNQILEMKEDVKQWANLLEGAKKKSGSSDAAWEEAFTGQAKRHKEIMEKLQRENNRLRGELTSKAEEMVKMHKSNIRLKGLTSQTEGYIEKLTAFDKSEDAKYQTLMAAIPKFKESIDNHEQALAEHESHRECEQRTIGIYQRFLRRVVDRLKEDNSNETVLYQVQAVIKGGNKVVDQYATPAILDLNNLNKSDASSENDVPWYMQSGSGDTEKPSTKVTAPTYSDSSDSDSDDSDYSDYSDDSD